jgi:hypothetical protein
LQSRFSAAPSLQPPLDGSAAPIAPPATGCASSLFTLNTSSIPADCPFRAGSCPSAEPQALGIQIHVPRATPFARSTKTGLRMAGTTSTRVPALSTETHARSVQSSEPRTTRERRGHDRQAPSTQRRGGRDAH